MAFGLWIELECTRGFLPAVSLSSNILVRLELTWVFTAATETCRVASSSGRGHPGAHADPSELGAWGQGEGLCKGNLLGGSGV